MKDIPISQFVSVDITRQAQLPSRAGFGTALILGVSGVIGASERIRFYFSIDGVLENFSTTDEEYKAALAYFSQSPRPARLAIGRRIIASIAAELRCGRAITTNINTWKAVTNGEFTISINGVSNNITAIDFSTVASLNDVAARIQTALRAKSGAAYTASTCVYNAKAKTFYITSGTTGASSTITKLSAVPSGSGTDISGTAAGNNKYLDGAGSGANVFNGQIADADAKASLDAVKTVSNDWYIPLLTKEARDSQVVKDVAAWCEAEIKIFLTESNDEAVLNPLSVDDIAYYINDLKYARTSVFYSSHDDQYPAAAWAGKILPYDPGTVNWMFKTLAGISPVDLSANDLTALKAKKANSYILSGGIDNTIYGYVGSGEFIDIIHGTDWLQDAIQKNVYGKLITELKISYTDTGVLMLSQELERALKEAERKGFLAGRMSEDGKTYINAYAINITPVALVPASERQAREYKYLKFVAYYASAINSVGISGTIEY